MGLQQAPEQEQKKDRFGKYKSTVCVSFIFTKTKLINFVAGVDSWLIRLLEVSDSVLVGPVL